MAESSRFHTTSGVGDGPGGGYTAAQMQEFMRDLFTHDGTYGIGRGRLNEFTTTGSTSPVAVAAGIACVNGLYYKSDASTNVTIPTPTTSTRIDRVVLRYTGGATQTVRITRIAGTEGTGTPPSMTQVEGSSPYDVALYQVSITTGGAITLTDERRFARSPLALGIADGTTLTFDGTNKYIKVADGGIGTTQLANLAVTAAKIANSTIDNSKISPGSIAGTALGAGEITATQIANATITGGKIASATITGSNIASATITGSNIATGTVTSTNILDATITGTDIAAATITGSNIAAATIAASNIVSGTITATQIANATITGGKIAASTIDNSNIVAGSLAGTALGAGEITATQLAANAVTTVKITDANVTTAKLADNSVDDTKAGDRVPQFYRRQGGSATDWNTAGTTTQTPTAVRMQGGSIAITMSGVAFASTSVTFPVSFSAKPLVYGTCEGTSIQGIAVSSSITSSGCTITLYSAGGVQTGTFNVHWLAIGAE